MQMLENFAQPHECSLTAFVSIPFPVTVLQAKLDWFVSAAHIQDDIEDSMAITQDAIVLAMNGTLLALALQVCDV